MDALTVEELALQRIFDLKNEVALEFESHQRLFDEALLSNVFLKGFDPPPWLSINGKRGEIPILSCRRPSYSVFKIGSGGTEVHRQDSLNSIREQEQFSELYGRFFCKRKRASSSVDRPSCPEVVVAKKPRVEESVFVAPREIDGDQGKGLVKDAQEEEKGEEQGFVDAQHGENEVRRHLVDVAHGGTEGKQGLFDAQPNRNEEENVGSKVENVKGVEKGARGGPRRRGAKEKNNDAVSPFLGRITRSRAKQCQVPLSAKKDIGKRRNAARSKQSRGTRRNASAKGASGREVSEEPKDVMELLSSAAVTKPQIGGKSSPLMTAFRIKYQLSELLPFAAATKPQLEGKPSTLMTAFGIEDQLSESPMMTKSQIRNKSSLVVAESQVETKLSTAMTQLQNEYHLSPVMNHWQIEDNAQRDDIECTEGTTKKSELKYASLEPGCGGSEDIDHKTAQEEDTLEKVERSAGGESAPKDDCRRRADSCDAEQLETSNLTDTAQKQEIPNATENFQQHDISDTSEATQLNLREEEHPMEFRNQLQDNFCLVEEGAEGEVPSVLRPFENRKSMDTIPTDTTLVSNATCTPQEMGASQCKEIFSGKVDLLEDNLKSTPTLAQDISSIPRYCGKSGLSDSPRPSKRSYVFERSVFSDNGSHPISVIVNLLGDGLVQDVPHSPFIEGAGHKLSLKANAGDMTVMDVPLRYEREDANAIGIGLGEISICPNEKIPDQDELDTALYEDRDKYEVNPSNLGFIHHRTASFDSALGLSCHNLHKNESDITGDLTNKLRNRSVDCCKKNLGKETNNCSNIVANTGGQECLKALSFRRFRSLSGSSIKLPSQGNEGQNLKGGRSASPVDVSTKIPGKENDVSQMPEDSELNIMTEKVDEPFFNSQKSWDSQGKVGAYDSALAICSPDESAEGQIETSCNAPSHKLLDADTDFMDRALLSSGKLFSKNMVEVKEEGGMELHHNTWPKYQKRSGQAQQQFHSAGQPRLWQTESCSKILDYDTSIRLSNGGIEVTSKDAGLIFQSDGVAKPCTSDSKGNCDVDNPEQRNDNIKNIPLPKDFSCAGSTSSEAFPDQQSVRLLSSQTKKDVKQSLRYSEYQQRAKLILEECSTRMGLYPRLSLTELPVAKCGTGNENVRRSSPSCISYSTTNEAAFGSTRLSQRRVDSMCFQATGSNTSDACLQDQSHLHATSLKSHPFRSSFEVTSPQNHGTEGDHRILPAGLMTPAPSKISQCRTLTPLDAHWSHAMGLQEHKECSREYWGKIYAMNDAYMTAHELLTDKFQTSSGINGVGAYGTKLKNPPSLIPAGGTLFERLGKNSVDKDSNFISKRAQMIKEHVGCFRIEEESGVEEESMDHPISMKQVENRFGSSTKKSVLGAKKVLIDSSSAKQNSPVTTPAGGRFFERISTNSTYAGSNLLSNKASMNQNYAYSFNNEEEIAFEKENRDPSVPMNEFQKRYGSSVKKKVLRNRNTQAYHSNVNQISPTKSNQKSNNLLSNVRSFIPLVHQKPTAASMMTGKRDIKVKALEAAEAAKRMEEKREQERKMRKELARRGEQEKHVQEKHKEEQYRGERGEETIGTTSDCSNKSISNGVVRKKTFGGALPKSHTENSSQLDTFAYGVDLKLRRAFEAKTKMEQEKVRKLEEEQRRKEEERKKKEAELAAKKRKREDIEKKDREEKRKRLEEVHRQQKEIEEQLRAEKEVKEQRRRALDEYERKRKATEEEAKKQRRIEKEKEAAERRRRLEEDAKASKFVLKDVKHLEEIYQQQEATHQANEANAGKISSMCKSFAKSRQPESEGQLMPGINLKLLQSTEPDTNIQSYEISPYKGSDEDDDDEDAVSGKFIPLWARKENLIQHLTSQQYIDPDEIFTGAKTCSLNEVFGTNGSLRRKDFHRRSKSGEWLADKFTWKEEYQYKLQMGYITKG